MMVKPRRQVNHLNDFRNGLGAAAEAGGKMADTAVILLDGDSQILAREELILGDEPVEPLPAVTEGSGRRRALSRTQLSTVTSLMPRMRAMPQKLMLPVACSISASAFICGGLPLGGVIVKLRPHASQR